MTGPLAASRSQGGGFDFTFIPRARSRKRRMGERQTFGMIA